MRKHIITIIIIAIALVLGRVFINQWNKFTASNEAKNRVAPTVTVEEVQNANVIRQYEAPARVMAKYRVEVLARTCGAEDT